MNLLRFLLFMKISPFDFTLCFYLAVFALVSLAEQRERSTEVPRRRFTPAHVAVYSQLHERFLTSSVRETDLVFSIFYHVY